MLSCTFSDNVFFIYCFVDYLLKGINTKTDKQRKFTDAQVISTALIAAKKFRGNYHSTLDFL
jgi:hypothetical protein